MASGNNATSPQSSTSNLASRFSSLKVFKFSKGNDNRNPPPPPPKDEFYLRNRSLASLLPDNQSLAPSSPMSPELPYQFSSQRSPDANQSSMSLASSAASGFSSPPVESKSRPQSRGKERALAFLKFGKRSPRSPSTSRKESVEAEPQPDDGISTPFNFQHNIHVNDELGGMPPSWSTSLAQHGFSEDEIAMIQSRRAESRSPSTQKLFNLRPSSPTIPHPYQPNASPPAGANTVPVIANPAPRTTSLPRQYSDASLRSGQQRPPLPFSQTSASMSTSSLQSSKAPSVSSRLMPQRHPNSQSHHGSQLSMSHSSDSNHSGSGREDSVPLASSFTPQRKAPSPGKSHTTNESISNNIYPSASAFNGHQRTESNASKRLFGSQPDTRNPSIPSTSARPLNTSSNTSNTTSPPFLPPIGGPSIQAKRAPGSAPRLSISLHSHSDSSDLSSWAGALFENLASGDLDGKFSPTAAPTSPQSAPATAAFKPMNLQPNRRQPSPPSPLAPPVKLQVVKPDPPAHEPPVRSSPSPVVASKGLKPPALPPLEDREELGQEAYMSPPYTADSLGSSSSPLWSQLEGMLGQSVSVQPPDDDDHGPYSAALAEQFSPTLPFSPEEERMAAQRRMRTESRAKDTLGRDDEDYRLSVNTVRPNRDSARSSTSTIAAATTIVRHVSIIRRAGAFVIDNSKARASRAGPAGPPPTSSLPTPPTLSEERYPPSPSSPAFDIDAEYGEQLNSPPSSAQSQDAPTPTTGNDLTSPLNYYLNPSPSPSQTTFSVLPPKLPSFDGHTEGVWDDDGEYDEGEEPGASLVVPPHVTTTSPSPARPTIVINDEVSPGGGLAVPLPSGTPLSPFERYRGWQSEVVAPLEEFIDDQVDPHDHYVDLKEIAEGESGSVYSARLTHKDAGRLRLPALVKARDSEDIANGREILVAIKSVAILPSGSQKLNDLRHELTLMRGLAHENLISLDALYVDLLEDTLWIRMELMERSLADVIALVDNGLILQDRTMARFASDILKGLEYLQLHNITHRDIRSDNLLLNTKGVLKITDFANARQVTDDNPLLEDPAGVLYWQAPEVRSPPYNALKIDVWSLGATVWEMAETQPPFADTNQFAERWPSVSRPEMHSPAFHDFLLLCSEPAATRPSAGQLLDQSSFIKNACGRPVIVQLLAQCTTIESSLQ